jgi:pyruvate,water dikinase
MWVKTITRPGNVQFDEMLRGYGIVKNMYFPMVVKSYIGVPSGNDYTDLYFKPEEWNLLMKRLADLVLKNKDPLKYVKDAYKKFGKEYLGSVKPFQKDLSGVSNKELLAYYERFKTESRKMFLFFYTPWAINEIIEPSFIEKVRQRYDKDAGFILSSVGGLTKQVRYNKQLLILLSLKQKGKLTGSALKKHSEKWGYLNVYVPNHHPFTPDDFADMVKSLKPDKKIAEINNEIEKNTKAYKKALELLKKDKELLSLAKLINFYVYLRTERIDLYREATMLSKPFYKELSRRIGLKDFESSFMMIGEIIDFLKTEKKPNLDEIRERAKVKYCWYCIEGDIKLIIDKEQIKRIIEKELKPATNIEQVSGTMAYKGPIVRGTAKVVISIHDRDKFKRGDILVIPMTRPEFTSIMEKASAIVTDEGGITCHAAIMAREMRKPCIIGTKIATKVFKDGDLIEVDANKGIVRKINKL